MSDRHLVSSRYFGGKAEQFTFMNGTATVHARKVCFGTCPIHFHTPHVGAEMPMLLRETGLVEHICIHGVGHPCPDSAAYLGRLYDQGDAYFTHGCDGCLHEEGKT